MKYSFWDNVWYTISKAVKYNKRLLPYTFIYTVCSVVLTIMLLFFPKVIIDEMTGRRDVHVLAWIMVLFLMISSLLSYSVSFLKNRTYSDFHEFRCLCLQEYQQKCFELTLDKVESPDFLNKINMAKICLYDNDKGFEGVLRRLFMLMGAIVTILYYGAAIILFQPVLFVLLILNAIVPYMISFYSKKYECPAKSLL